jgi:cytidylate kinase
MTKASEGWVGSDVEARIAVQIDAWENVKPLGNHRLEAYPFVAISREFGCEGLLLSQTIVETLNERCHPSIPWVSYSRELLDKVALKSPVKRALLDSIDARRREKMSTLFDNIINHKTADAPGVRKLAEFIRALALHGHAVLVGRGSSLVTQDLKNGLHVRLVAPRAWRVHTIAANRDLSSREAEKIVAENEKQRRNYIKTFFVLDSADPLHYDLVMDNSRFNLTQITEIIFTALKGRFGETLVGK